MQHSHYKKNTSQVAQPRGEAGFTIIEFIVIINIFAILAGILLFNFSGYSSSVSLSNLTHDIALVIRQAQVYGQSGALVSPGETDPTQRIMRGVYVEYIAADNAYSKSIIIFQDDSGNNEYDGETIDTVVNTVRIQSADQITEVCVGQSDPLSQCGSTDNLTIGFLRPEPRPVVRRNSENTEYNAAAITIRSPKGIEKQIHIYPTGQIQVE